MTTKGVMEMQPVIKSSSELRKNYNNIAEICRTSRIPVFLTRNGEGDMVIMDIETYGRREEDLAIAERLLATEKARLSGTQDYSVDEFESNMRKAIKKGARVHG
jgi:PHD/YefM family antitoxin component YafN of YafNO toxin-antitoxin module